MSKIKFNCLMGRLIRLEKTPLYEHAYLWAEEGGSLNNNAAEWSFGNGAIGGAIPIFDGWVLAGISFNAVSAAANASVVVEAFDLATSNTLETITLAPGLPAGVLSGKVEFSTPPSLDDVLLSFRTVTRVGSIRNARVCAYLRRQIN